MPLVPFIVYLGLRVKCRRNVTAAGVVFASKAEGVARVLGMTRLAGLVNTQNAKLFASPDPYTTLSILHRPKIVKK